MQKLAVCAMITEVLFECPCCLQKYTAFIKAKLYPKLCYPDRSGGKDDWLFSCKECHLAIFNLQ